MYPDLSFLNEVAAIPHNRLSSWAKRDRKEWIVPKLTQRIVDYVDPDVRETTSENPGTIQRELGEASRNPRILLVEHRKRTGGKTDAYLEYWLELHALYGDRIRLEIQAAIHLYSAYFDTDRHSFFDRLKSAIATLRELHAVVGDRAKETERYRSTTNGGPFTPGADADSVQAIIDHETDDFPMQALAEYCRSHVS